MGWSQTRLGEEAGLSLATVKRYETGSALRVSEDAVNAMQNALERAGVIFVAENGEGPGVRLKKKLENSAELTQRIEVLEHDIAKTDPEPPKTPAGGMQRLERARKVNVVKKLKNKRTKLAKARK
jgi:transcriptional regulator with XRE-family HTH domain